MKTPNSILFIAIAILLVVNSGCQKEPTRPILPPPPTSPRNTAPIANAGNDQSVFTPADFCILNGLAQDLENNIQTILWKNISGPISFLIEHPDSLSTKVSNLQIGAYQFELTVTDSLGMYGKDTLIILVTQMSLGGGGTRPAIAPEVLVPDRLVLYPTNFTYLSGSMSLWGNIIQTISWSKISGPSSFLIETLNSLRTKVSNLQIGVYQFEVFVQDTAGLSDRDTCTVTVGQISDPPNEVILSNQVWSQAGLLWGSQITINNVFQYLPAGSVFRAYIKRENSTNWEELIMDDPNSYFAAGLMNGNLSLWSTYDETDAPDIKLVY